ncbi:MAG: DNA repair protein RadC [Candidatus Eisenbacteria bacterium]|jgi:DNA repair protein RadC|nr:DNA repair protein RadC [Candidatus Eisenbacteria bacterium]
MDTILAKGHRRRLRCRFLHGGGADFAPHELLELALSFAVPRKDTKVPAKLLMRRFGSIAAVLEAEPGELRSVEGVGECGVTLLKLMHALALTTMDPVERHTDFMRSPNEVAVYFRARLRGLREERFVVACLDAKNRIREVRELQQGTVDQAVVYPRRVAEAALESKAKSVVVVHNHPSGDAEPSEDDVRLTRELKVTLSAVGVALLDHLVIGAGAHFSFREAGLV